MKSFRLIVHQKTFSEDDLVINQKDYAEAKKNDIVEIYQSDDDIQKRENKISPEEVYPHLLLQIKSFRDDLQSRETISVEQSIATAFGLKIYKNVNLRLVNPDDVALDSIELTFKDQYLGRSEMWRLKLGLVNTCVYINKKLEFCGGAIRCQVFEMWAKGEKVACGVITSETKIVFRSSTAMVYIFLQMSSEMWDFDMYGNLYFEKAVNGFLADLFSKWKTNSSNHEVTVVMFSRTFYKASQLEEFPEHMRECLQKDSKGKYYEDFYRVAVQNERYDDWSNILVTLRSIFQQYLKAVLEYHKLPNSTTPSALNSSSAEGNFLEVLNMSLNVFEKHYLNRSFDRTGQLSVVVTPGVGVFEVDRELTNITKQRIIDGGVGCDLVCVGEQPLHAVPLLKFRTKSSVQNVPHDYSMPHWINVSFYSTNKKFGYSSFTPRVKVPPPLSEREMRQLKRQAKKPLVAEEDGIHNSFFDYDAYDSGIFQTINPHHTQDILPAHQIISSKHFNVSKKTSDNPLEFSAANRGIPRNLSDPEIIQHKNDFNPRSKPIAIPPGGSNFLSSPPFEEKDFSPPVRMVVGSEGSPTHESRALINPFDPSHVTVKLTSNRRRWTHVFPRGPTGVLIQQHHFQTVTKKPEVSNLDVIRQDRVALPASKMIVVTPALYEYCKKKTFQSSPAVNTHFPLKQPTKSLTLLWGATGEQEWSPALTAGVDWKSLTIPACLPITTDYFPEHKTLNTEYVVSLYSLVPDSVYADFAQQRTSFKKPLTTDEVFKELISQRLSQGFQVICLNQTDISVSTSSSGQSLRNPVLKKSPKENDEAYYLSVGRVFHKIALSGNTVSVTRYRPRHPHPGFRYEYRYRFHAPKHEKYDDSYAIFTTEKLEHYNWNYLDHYVCTGGYTTDFVLVDALKYWRLKIYFLNINHPGTKKILEGSEKCDIYSWAQNNDYSQVVEGYLKFVETAVNKIKKSNHVSKKPRMSLSIQTLPHLPQLRRNSVSSVFQNPSRLSDKVMASSLSNSSSGGPCLKQDCSSLEVIEAMKHSSHGLSFVTSLHGLPHHTFISADAVHWVLTNMENVASVEDSLKILERLLKENLIRHASGGYTKKFVYGFCLFYILPDKDEKDIQVSGDLESFETDFFEVEIKQPLNWGGTKQPRFLSDDVIFEYLNIDVEDPEYKRMRLDTDITNKSDRTEWGHVKYQTEFVPDRAYELTIEWLTSSGSIMSELLFGWHRKAQSCGLQMIPIPHDPFALPSSGTTDPLRAPIFVPLNVECLESDEMFKNFSKTDWELKLFLFKEAIIQRFGFVPSISETVETSKTKEYQYVHATGTIFIMISNTACKPERSKSTSLTGTRNATDKYTVLADIVPSPHEAYITRHVSNQRKLKQHSENIGFLWAWNHMISRRWRTNQGVDTAFQLKVLKDFRDFCGNCDNRLVNFWRDSCNSVLSS